MTHSEASHYDSRNATCSLLYIYTYFTAAILFVFQHLRSQLSLRTRMLLTFVVVLKTSYFIVGFFDSAHAQGPLTLST